MSHIITYEAKLIDMQCLERCCNRNSYELLKDPQSESYKFGLDIQCTAAIKLKEWCYPIFVDTKGTLHFDNYYGNWGSNESLDLLKQEYSREACYMQAEEQGYTVVSDRVGLNGERLMELIQY